MEEMTVKSMDIILQSVVLHEKDPGVVMSTSTLLFSAQVCFYFMNTKNK